MDLNFKHIVHREHLGTRLVEIFDTKESRSLYFGGKYLQSQLLHNNPERLALIYTRYMVSSLLLIPNLRRVLVIGVGAGSLVHFLHHHFPQCHIDCVDHSERIIEIAQDFFHLQASEQIAIHCCDGREFLTLSPSPLPYDLILVDAFDEEGMAPAIYDASFFKLCSAQLHRHGVASFNIWHNKKSAISRVIRQLQNHFPHGYLLPIPYRDNVIAHMRHSPVPWPRLLLEKEQARRLQQEYRIEFRAIGRLAIRHNMSLARRISWYLERTLKPYS